MKTFVDLFCGVGGFHIPLADRGLKCVFASEIDPHAAESYEANFGLKPHGDITKIDAAAIPAHDVLCAGFPCQPFSNSGNGKGLDDVRGGLFHEIVRIAAHCQPKIILLENVPTILTINRGRVLDMINNDLDGAGYRVNYSVLNSGAYGIPQARSRCYFVCIRKDLLLSFTPPPPLPMAQLRCVNDITLPDEETAHLILQRDDIYFDRRLNQGRVYKLNRIGGIGKKRKVDMKTKPPSQAMRIFDGDALAVTQMANGHGAAANGGAYLVANKNDVEKDSQGNRIYDGDGLATTTTADGGGVGKSAGVYLLDKKGGTSQGRRIYDPDGLSVTQMANGGGGGVNSGYYLVNSHVRTLHIKEVMQLMGFETTHIISKGRQGFRQMGNAVIPAMVGFIYDGISHD